MRLSSLPKTWLLDVDGTLVVHNGHLKNNEQLLNGVKEFTSNIDEKDMVILLTSRSKQFKKELEEFLLKNEIRYNHIIYDLPFGERILVNDKKPSGLKTAYAINKTRNCKFELEIEIDESL